jgi:hypothetical protein
VTGGPWERLWRSVCPPGATLLLVGPDGHAIAESRGARPWAAVPAWAHRHPDAWVAVQYDPADPAAFPWTAVDWDNKDGNATRARAIRVLEAAVARLAGLRGIGYVFWPSKTTVRHPDSGAGHSFFLLHAAPEVARRVVASLLEAASRRAGIPLAAAGLEPGGPWWFPPDVPVAARLTLFRAGSAANFLACWADQAKLAAGTFFTQPDELQ